MKTDSHYRDVGDEPLQIKLKFPGTVVVRARNAPRASGRIRAEHPEVDLIIMDDGFQHRYVEPKINIVMIDATRPIQHDRMLLLERFARPARRAAPRPLFRGHEVSRENGPIDRRIMRKVLIQVAYQRVYFTRFESFMPQPLYPDAAPDELLLHGRQVIALFGHRQSQAVPFLRRCANATRSCRR